AAELEILPLLEEFYDPARTKTPERRLHLKGKILEAILESYFDARSVQAEADREEGTLNSMQEFLEDRRDRAVGTNNATNFIASGTLNTIGSILGFSNKLPPFPGNFNQMMSGVVSTGMSMYALKQNSGGKTTGAGKPTVLAELFGRPTDEDTAYPESVWRFFHSKAPGATLTRVQEMEQDWILREHLEPHNSPRQNLKLDLVCGVPVSKKAIVTIEYLEDQIKMIADVSTLAELMTRHLRDLVRMIDSDITIPGVPGEP
ncbi:MAG: hypothetical protein K2Z81_25515, partial [Cyanobacteria bacterium]|nr:hypothetical protein [Cyanobacteriota bacterium]